MKISKSGFDAVQQEQEQESRIARGGLGAGPHYCYHLAKSRLSAKVPGPPKPNRTMATDAIRIERPTTNSKLFAHTRWDAVPAAAGIFHLTYLFGLYLLFPHAPLWVMLILGFVYSLMVNANINGVGHHFIHNPF